MAVVIASIAASTAAMAASTAAISAANATGHPMPIWASLAIIGCYGFVILVAICLGAVTAGAWLWDKWRDHG